MIKSLLVDFYRKENLFCGCLKALFWANFLGGSRLGFGRIWGAATRFWANLGGNFSSALHRERTCIISASQILFLLPHSWRRSCGPKRASSGWRRRSRALGPIESLGMGPDLWAMRTLSLRGGVDSILGTERAQNAMRNRLFSLISQLIHDWGPYPTFASAQKDPPVKANSFRGFWARSTICNSGNSDLILESLVS